jgi:hypothetical protein
MFGRLTQRHLCAPTRRASCFVPSMGNATRISAAAFALAVGLVGCGSGDSDDGTETPSTGGDTSSSDGFDGTVDVGQSDAVIPGGDGTTGADADEVGGGGGEIPEGAVAIAFVADDTANRTYQGGQIQWTGSFAWDKTTNFITYSSSWLPGEREWPRLYDDGPRSAGGHEAEGQTSGDGKFSTEVFCTATEETVFEYGALNEFGTWIWIGPNGQFTVKPGDTGRTEIPGVAFPKFGNRDMKISIDLAKLNTEFKTITAETHSVYLKGTMNSWTTVQLLDNGKKGDLLAGDGIFTYQHSEKLGPHDGLAFPGQHVQFVFVFAFKEQDPADGLEYKFPVDALLDGVAAMSGKGDTWMDETVILEPDSYGNVKNTTVIVSAPPPECDGDTPCPDGKLCDAGTCVTEPECSAAKVCPDGKMCVAGLCEAEPECTAVKPCGDGLNCVGGVCQTEAGCSATKPCPLNESCVGGVCKPTEKPECDASTPCNTGFVCQTGKCIVDIPSGETPAVSLVDPSKGPASGGTPVVISGVNFATGATVTFGAEAATNVSVKTTGTITAVAPKGAFGAVTVTVKNPDGKQGSYPGGFSYTSFAPPTLSAVAPTEGQLAGGEPVTLTGTGFQPGAKVTFGLSECGQVSVAPSGNSLTCLTPAGDSKGAVDVTIANPDAQSATKIGAFTYRPPAVQYAILVEPFDLSALPGATLPTVQVQIYHPGVTPGDGAGDGLLVDLGHGPKGSLPDATWTWVPAKYKGQAGYQNNDDVWQATFGSGIPVGTYSWAFRASLDGETWVYADRDSSSMTFSATAAGSLAIEAPPVGLAIFSVSPAYGSVAGGTTITITGQEFVAGATVKVGGVAATNVQVVSASSITATTGAGTYGSAAVEVTSGGSTAKRTDAFRYTYFLATAPTVDGTVGSDWPAWCLLADDTAAAGWDNNDLDKLYVGFDDQYLYIGIVGAVESTNAMLAFIDTDFGAGTGFSPTGLSDNDGPLDGAITGTGVKVFVPNFGAEYAAGAFGVAGQELTSLDASGRSGVRGFAGSPGNFSWLPGHIVQSATGLELRIERAVLGLAPSASGHEVALFVRIVNQDGEYPNPEGLPSSTNGDGSVDTIVRVWVN